MNFRSNASKLHFRPKTPELEELANDLSKDQLKAHNAIDKFFIKGLNEATIYRTLVANPGKLTGVVTGAAALCTFPLALLLMPDTVESIRNASALIDSYGSLLDMYATGQELQGSTVNLSVDQFHELKHLIGDGVFENTTKTIHLEQLEKIGPGSVTKLDADFLGALKENLNSKYSPFGNKMVGFLLTAVGVGIEGVIGNQLFEEYKDRNRFFNPQRNLPLIKTASSVLLNNPNKDLIYDVLSDTLSGSIDRHYFGTQVNNYFTLARQEFKMDVPAIKKVGSSNFNRDILPTDERGHLVL